MLTPMTHEELDRYADWAYRLALDLTRSGYPTYADGIKTRAEFIAAARKGMDAENEEVLLFRVGDAVRGWIWWGWQPEERYAQPYSFLTESDTGEALAAFTAYAAARCPGCALHMGFPAENEQAVRWLDKHDFRLLDASVNHTLFFDRYAPREMPPSVSLMSGAEDEAAFRALHTSDDLYWTAPRILANAEDWRVYLHRQEGVASAALYAKVAVGGWPEIFGMAGHVTEGAYRALLTACLNDCKALGCHHMTYFEEDETKLPILAELGCEVVSRYVCYQKVL